MSKSDNNINKSSSKKQIIAVIVSLAVICVAVIIGFNFKKIAALLPLPFEVPESWNDDGADINDIKDDLFQSSAVNDAVQSSVPESTQDSDEAWVEKYLEWFLTTDFPAFEQASEINNECAIEFGIMQCIKLKKDVEYKKNENGSTLIPASDVLAAARAMLPSLTITDKTVKDFVYDITTKTYQVPANEITPKYMWFITSNKKVDGGFALTVAFYPYDIITNNKIPTDKPEKTMLLTLKKNDSSENYKIVSYINK